MNSGKKKHICVGILAHVDAGKTTLSEQILCHTGAIRKAGRVDHGDAFMDNEDMERQRGITIFTEQAAFELDENTDVILLDTPGHEDFAAQRIRAMQVMDGCILVVSGTDGVQSSTKEIYGQLKGLGIPILFFINKADQAGAEPNRVLEEIRRDLGATAVFADWMSENGREEIALLDEELLEAHLMEQAEPDDYKAVLKKALLGGSCSPVCVGSALMDQGVSELLQVLSLLEPRGIDEQADFSGIVYRIRRLNGQSQVYVRVYSGVLVPRMEVETVSGLQKVHTLARAQGTKLTPVDRCEAGEIAVLSGIRAVPGERIGKGAASAAIPEPMMVQALTPQPPLTLDKLLRDLRELETEEPNLCVVPGSESVQVALMGKTQQEVLLEMLQTRFGDAVSAGPPRILYRETISGPVTGIGHYEPLRHYAEVWLRMLPGPRGSGIVFESRCAPNSLDENWQRLIRTHVFECAHPGVLTGSPITDMKIILLSGRSHLKHTEGGDFREATRRAIRQGLMQAETVLLEPFVYFECRMQKDLLSRVVGDLLGMDATLGEPIFADHDEVIQPGTCRMEAFYTYPERFASLTHGFGRISMVPDGYAPCKNQGAVADTLGYHPMEDAEHPSSSVFCSHGAGFAVAWNRVRDWAHLREEIEVEPDV